MKSDTLGHAVAPSDPGSHNGVFANNAVGSLLASFLTCDASSGNATTSNGAREEYIGRSPTGSGDLLNYASRLLTIAVQIIIALRRYSLPTPRAMSASHDITLRRNKQLTT
jgi:hypothetical protein